MAITNGTITTGGTAQNALGAGTNHMAVILQAGASDLYFNVGADAGGGIGEKIPAGQSATIRLAGERLSVWSADTDAAYSIRPTI